MNSGFSSGSPSSSIYRLTTNSTASPLSLRVYLALENLDSVEAKVTYPPRFEIQEGDQIYIKFHPENIMVFNYPDNLEFELALE